MVAAGYFGIIDYVFMAIYVIVLIGLGLYLKGKASESIEDYIIGGHKIPWWAMGISGMAQFLDLTGTALIVSFLFMLGPQGLYIEFRGGAVLILEEWSAAEARGANILGEILGGGHHDGLDHGVDHGSHRALGHQVETKR